MILAARIVTRITRTLIPMPLRNVLRPYWNRILLPSSAQGIESNLADLDPLGKPFAEALRSMYRGEPQLGSDGRIHQLHAATKISIEEGLWLYRLCRDTKPQQTMEIGCAYGFSTLYLLAGGTASHIAIDPHENSSWSGIGVGRVQAVGMSSAFRLIEEKSIVAIPTLMCNGVRFDIIFIDGNHCFDDVLADFTLCALTCKMGGYIILDDMWMPAISKVVSFVRRNRKDFSEVATSVENIAAFQRTAEDQRTWDHFEDFQ